MSDYGRIVTTNQGKNMVTESIRTKSAIIFTKISLGDGLLNGETIETMTGLKHRLLDGNIPKINPLGNGEIEAVSTVSNSELTTGFFARELGLFAKLGEEGEEQLFAYTNAGSNASYIPPNTSVDEKMLGIQLGIGDATVQINYQSHLYITYEQLEDGIAHHNSDENAHGGLLQNLKSQLATHNTDISSHPAITAMIAKILGSSDWQEEPVATLKDIKNKLGEGGIVAQRFGESGFVKYANGFTIQWGYIADGKDINRIISVSLLLPCNGKYVALPVGESNNTNFNNSLDHPCVVIAKTSTAFKVQIDDYMSGISWVCIGIC